MSFYEEEIDEENPREENRKTHPHKPRVGHPPRFLSFVAWPQRISLRDRGNRKRRNPIKEKLREENPKTHPHKPRVGHPPCFCVLSAS